MLTVKSRSSIYKTDPRRRVEEVLTSRSLPVQEEPLKVDALRIAAIFHQQNLSAGRDRTAVIPAEEFLTHLRPSVNDRKSWPYYYHELQSLYRQGQI